MEKAQKEITSQERRQQTFLLIGIVVFFFVSSAVGAFLTVYLKEEGFSTSQLGIINAVSSIAAMLAISFWGIISDWLGSVKKVLIFLVIVGVGLNAIIPMIPTQWKYAFIVLVIAIPFMKFFYMPMGNLNENLLVRKSGELNLDYGKIRSIGSLFYGIGGILTTVLILPRLGVSATFWICALVALPAVLLLIPMPDVQSAPRGRRQKLNFRELLTNKPYLTYLIASFILNIGLTSHTIFMPYFIAEIGIDDHYYGYVISCSAFLEIPSMWILSKMRKRMDYRKMIVLSLLIQALAILIQATICRSLGVLLVGTVMTGLSVGIRLPGALSYLQELAPAHLKSSAQAFYQTVNSVAAILSSLIGGIVFELMGARPFFLAIFGICLVGILVMEVPVWIQSRKKASV